MMVMVKEIRTTVIITLVMAGRSMVESVASVEWDGTNREDVCNQFPFD